MYSRRERDLAGRFIKPWRATATDAGRAFQSALSWKQVERFKKKHPRLPLILKGIATAEDAEIAVQHGVEVVYVSNHGGRQLDHGLGSAAVLPEVLQAVKRKAEGLGDGGLLGGPHRVRTIRPGPKNVGVGRPTGPSAAPGGAAGPVLG